MEMKVKTGLKKKVISMRRRSGHVRQTRCCKWFSKARLVLTKQRVCGAQSTAPEIPSDEGKGIPPNIWAIGVFLSEISNLNLYVSL